MFVSDVMLLVCICYVYNIHALCTLICYWNVIDDGRMETTHKKNTRRVLPHIYSSYSRFVYVSHDGVTIYETETICVFSMMRYTERQMDTMWGDVLLTKLPSEIRLKVTLIYVNNSNRQLTRHNANTHRMGANRVVTETESEGEGESKSIIYNIRWPCTFQFDFLIIYT